MTALQCFVAMAIRDGADVDALHFKIIKPLLKRHLGISAIRVDERHHNENIDKRILVEIDGADFVIADLTYERPSVYFEAGYAQGKGIPVVYTCRADHLRKKSEYEVHFDLRQRNIVVWSSPKDGRFAERLLARVRHTIAPLLRSRQHEQGKRQAEADFASMSSTQRGTRLREVADRLVKKSGFTLDSSYRSEKGHRVWKSTLETMQVLIFRSVPKGELAAIHAWSFGDPMRAAIEKYKMARRRVHHVVAVTENIVSRSRVESVFQDYVPIYENSWTVEQPTDEGRVQTHWFHVLDKVNSIPTFQERLEKLLLAINQRRAA
jgi:hypothetical protein